MAKTSFWLLNRCFTLSVPQPRLSNKIIGQNKWRNWRFRFWYSCCSIYWIREQSKWVCTRRCQQTLSGVFNCKLAIKLLCGGIRGHLGTDSIQTYRTTPSCVTFLNQSFSFSEIWHYTTLYTLNLIASNEILMQIQTAFTAYPTNSANKIFIQLRGWNFTGENNLCHYLLFSHFAIQTSSLEYHF